MIVDGPCFTPVTTIHDAGVWNTILPNVLDRENQRSVGSGDASSGALQQEIPFRPFYLFRQVDRCRPGLSIVCALGDYQLSRLIPVHTWIGAPPGPLISHAVCPSSHDKNRVSLCVYQNGRITGTVLGSR